MQEGRRQNPPLPPPRRGTGGEQEAPRKERLCSKPFYLFLLVGYFCHAALGEVVSGRLEIGFMFLQERLLAFLEELDLEERCEFREDTSLIKSGVLDSLNLFKLATWIEAEIDHQIDLTEFNLLEEWDTIADILKFIEEHRGTELKQGNSGEKSYVI